MKVVHQPESMAALADLWRRSGERIGLVPTMGALHEGHLSLVRLARAASRRVVVSIFVNPLQFGPGEDLARYPRRIEEDLGLLEREEVDVAFLPAAAALYPEGFETRVVPGAAAADLEGSLRPGHFAGVCTVVLKLFALAMPHAAWFGAKDAQQLAVVRRMARDLSLAVEIRVGATVREGDGLAMSSRNVFLDPAGRALALHLGRALHAALQAHEAGERRGQALLAAARTVLAAAGPGLAVQYLELRHPLAFQPVADPVAEAVLLVAARVGTTRLIDNVPLGPATRELLGEGARP